MKFAGGHLVPAKIDLDAKKSAQLRTEAISAPPVERRPDPIRSRSHRWRSDSATPTSDKSQSISAILVEYL
jgi:hypothetical protein